ncbi:3739_t:CDS:2 [Cetraspora pellucida]|uniref:3739_t:CDS:1 n=1 Tax=Cetraspora pellucida TaxID=1433469 RepID=A0A9N9EH48_9GLOM|nr:3739_t:CDS:2 [Cetraspora pellucida]
MEYDNFRNIEEVGKGGFSVVYKTSHEVYQEVAIKIITDSHKNKNRFLNEDGHIYGVLPYLAPEVLKGEQFTQQR